MWQLATHGPVGRADVVTDDESTFGVIPQLGILAGDECHVEPFREPTEAPMARLGRLTTCADICF